MIYDLTAETCMVRGPKREFCSRVPYHHGDHKQRGGTNGVKTLASWDDEGEYTHDKPKVVRYCASDYRDYKLTGTRAVVELLLELWGHGS